MKFIDYQLVEGRYIFRLCGIKLFTHKQAMKKKNNYIVLIKQNGKKVYNPKIKGLNVVFHGGCNIVKLYEPLPHFENCHFNLIHKNKIEIKGSKHVVGGLCIDSMYRSKVEIGEDFSIGGGHFIADYKAKIKIGNDCMFSSFIHIKTSDGHILYDTAAEKFFEPKDVIIGNHVWVGAYAKILKGSIIPNNCIVGLNSLVTKKFETQNSTIAGNPAKILKTGILWDREVYWRMKKLKSEKSVLDRFKNKL